jgi:FkbM family methyltransferase
MAEYRRNKIKTAWDITRRIENWPTAFDLRIRRHHPGLRLLRFRNGLNVVCRGGTRDWDVVHELMFARGYGRAMDYLHSLNGSPTVLDLGGNIGLFSLLAASTKPEAAIYAYEPGPPNFRLFEINRLANAGLSERIHLRREAVAGQTRTTDWFFDEQNPGGSGLFSKGGGKFSVQIRAFAEVLASLPGPVALAKIDIEGAEFELLAATPRDSWQRIQAISLELHDDPEGKVSPDDFLNQIHGHGFKIEKESVCSYFLHR